MGRRLQHSIARLNHRAAAERRSTMNDFLTSFSSDHTLLWALLIIGVIAVSAVGLHLFWTIVFRFWAALRGGPANNREDSR